jgi:hypothetical protein
MEATCFSSTSVDFQLNIWHYIPDDRNLRYRISDVVNEFRTRYLPKAERTYLVVNRLEMNMLARAVTLQTCAKKFPGLNFTCEAD